jgi:hypothetical protein
VGETLAGPTTFATWDEALMLAVPMLSDRGPADAERLGVTPHRIADVLQERGQAPFLRKKGA